MNKKEFSCVISKALDTMKYGYDDIKIRAKLYRLCETIMNKSEDIEELISILAGSKAEGVSFAEDPDSDTDFMLVKKQCICCDNLHPYDNGPEKMILLTVRDNTAPGYTKLKCKGSDMDKITNIMPDLIIQNVEGQNFVGHLLDTSNFNDSDDDDNDDDYENSFIVSGPAFTAACSVSNDNANSFICPIISFSWDFALAVEFTCTDHLQKWKERKRFNSWPGKDLIEEISQMTGHVVPVGNKGRESAHLEWRITYTEAELKLIHSLNEIQIKLYILLRMVAKKILKPICAEISSYIMKNVLFWFVERSPSYRFQHEHLIGILHLALRSLQRCIHRKRLSNYMIPERNMFARRFSDVIKVQLVEELHKLLYVQGLPFVLGQDEFGPLSVAVKHVMLFSKREHSEVSQSASNLSINTQQLLQEMFEKANEMQNQIKTTGALLPVLNNDPVRFEDSVTRATSPSSKVIGG
ncbi:uncharacterized protein LOC128550531 [Mercenaria mercenaria]|uniref:uncharacterized protein LOC128550531 n=1 Tax=Mercenaria mercenaria TaxID=6596 RepID=UPI00234FABF6|nr:uncharacterized protein LOC128550531 [Mercenaria mercenaria]